MTTKNQTWVFTGAFILLGIALGHFHDQRWIYFIVFVGANLLQSHYDNFLPLRNN